MIAMVLSELQAAFDVETWFCASNYGIVFVGRLHFHI